MKNLKRKLVDIGKISANGNPGREVIYPITYSENGEQSTWRLYLPWYKVVILTPIELINFLEEELNKELDKFEKR